MKNINLPLWRFRLLVEKFTKCYFLQINHYQILVPKVVRLTNHKTAYICIYFKSITFLIIWLCHYDVIRASHFVLILKVYNIYSSDHLISWTSFLWMLSFLFLWKLFWPAILVEPTQLLHHPGIIEYGRCSILSHPNEWHFRRNEEHGWGKVWYSLHN